MYTDLDAIQAAKNLFAVNGIATRLAGEYDANFFIQSDDGTQFLLKMSPPNQDKHLLELQNKVLLHLSEATLSFQIPVLINSVSGEWVADYRHSHNDTCFVRLFSYVPGSLLAHLDHHTPQLLYDLGRQIGYLTRALNTFSDSKACRYLKWDLKQAHWIKDHLNVINDVLDKQCVDYFVNKYLDSTLAKLSHLRHSVIHGDINNYNIIISDDSVVSGIIDFGDVVETATITELAIAVTYVMLNKPDPIAAAVEVIKGYHAIFPIEQNEIDILFELICLRLCVSVINSAVRKAENPQEAYLYISEQPAFALLHKLHQMDEQLVRHLFRAVCDGNRLLTKNDIFLKRQRSIGKNVSLSYHQPLLIVRGEGQYLYDENGKKYLDCVNNVSHVGHCHPNVVAAGQQQMSVLNTNTRYLHQNLVNYAERLLATLPPPLEVCYFVCSGSEANELALRLAETHTRNKHILVLDHAYHGNTTSLINISPYKFNSPGGKGKPNDVHVLPLPHNQFDIPLINHKVGTFICESLPSCGGQVVLPPQYLQHIYQGVRQSGGVTIADEVQVGLGRIGTHFWGFESQAVIPDIVTMGKPLGNGHPIGAVVTTRAIADSFCNGLEYFNTFGGNPVSCAIGLSVLDVIAEEKLQSHALSTGDYLKKRLLELKSHFSVIRDVRGLGLFIGVELVTNHIPSKDYTASVVNRMQELGILLSADGPQRNVLKIKPPMVFAKHDCDLLISGLTEVLQS